MSHRTASGYLLAIVVSVAATGCQPYGWVLKGDCSLELNRVAWINSRCGDCYEGGSACASGGEQGEIVQGSPGPYGPLDPAFHPVPMRSPYGPTPAEGALEAPVEDLPAPPDTIRAPAASAPRRLGEGTQRASWSYGRKPARPAPNYGPPRPQSPRNGWRSPN